jgi:hypothetical protein
VTAIGSGAATTVVVALTDADGFATDVAVIVTVPPVGTEEGAV